MRKLYYRDLWETRFQRILDLERESFHFYKDLLKKYETLFEGTRAKRVLEQIMKDEAHHARMAHRLLRLVKRRKVAKQRRKEK